MTIEEIEAKFRRLVNTNELKKDENLTEALDIIRTLLKRTQKVLDKVSMAQFNIIVSGNASIALDEIESDLKGYDTRKYY